MSINQRSDNKREETPGSDQLLFVLPDGAKNMSFPFQST